MAAVREDRGLKKMITEQAGSVRVALNIPSCQPGPSVFAWTRTRLPIVGRISAAWAGDANTQIVNSAAIKGR